MSRTRVSLIVAGLVVAMAAVTLSTQAQPPAGGRGGRGVAGGGRGQRGFGGPGGFRGFGSSNLLSLASNDAVQKETKMSDRQVAAVKKLSDETNNRRRTLMQKMREQTKNMQQQAAQQAQARALMPRQQANPSALAPGGGVGNPLVNSLNNRGYQSQIYGGQVIGGQAAPVNPLMQQQAAQFQGRMAANNARMQGSQMMRQTMDQVDKMAERDLGRILDKSQIRRIREIQLQSEGPSAVLRQDIAVALDINEEQAVEIQQALRQAGQVRRDMAMKSFQFMRSQMPAPTGGDNNAGGANSGNNPGGRRGGQPGTNGQAAQGNQGGQGGGPGGRGGPGGQNRRRFDPEAFRKVMEQPEVKAKMEEFQNEREQLRQQEYASVFKAMDRRQVSSFKKMLGKPFDVDALRRGFFRNMANNNGQGQGQDPNQTNAANTETAKPSTSAPQATTTPATKPATSRRPSLRERRGLGPG